MCSIIKYFHHVMFCFSCVDFSYMMFLVGKGLTIESTLSENDMTDLMETLGLTDFLLKESCSLVGWING